MLNGKGFTYDRVMHLWLVDVGDGTATRLTDGRTSDTEPAWSPDGTRIAFTSNRRRDADLVRGRGIHVVNTASRAVTAVSGKAPADMFRPTWLPDGRTIAALGHRYAGRAGSRNDIWLFAADGGDAARSGGRNLSAPHDLMPGSGMGSDVVPSEVASLIPSTDGRWLGFTAPVAGAYELWRIAVDDGRVERLTNGRHYVSAWHAVPGGAGGSGGTRIAFLRSSSTEPSDLWLLDVGPDAARATPRRLTSFNAEVLADIELREPVERHATVDGRDIQGWFLSGGDGRRPLVLEIHGGPHTLYGWAPVWEFQILAAAGIGVFACNPRGSEGYGQAFSDANHRDWGPGPMRDVLAGVDALVADGLADPDRLGVTGGSYGGYLTNWIVGHDRSLPDGDDLSLGQRHGRAVHDRRHLGRRVGEARIRHDAVGRPRVLPRDLAAGLRRPDPDAAPHPARRARHPDDGRPGRGAVHRAPLASPAGASAARARGDPRADTLGDAVPPGREPADRRGLVPPLPHRRPARPAATPEGARGSVVPVATCRRPRCRGPCCSQQHLQAKRGHKVGRGPRSGLAG